MPEAAEEPPLAAPVRHSVIDASDTAEQAAHPIETPYAWFVLNVSSCLFLVDR